MHNPALNIDTVVRILLAVRETGDWAEALDLAIPQRRRVKAEDLVVQPQVPPAATLHVCNINPATPLAELVARAGARHAGGSGGSPGPPGPLPPAFAQSRIECSQPRPILQLRGHPCQCVRRPVHPRRSPRLRVPSPTTSSRRAGRAPTSPRPPVRPSECKRSGYSLQAQEANLIQRLPMADRV